MKTRHLFIITLIMVLIIVLALFPTIFQEGNPLPVLTGILRLSLTDRDLVPISEQRLIQKNGPETALSDFLAAYSWKFKDRLGSGIFYKKNNNQLFVHARLFTRYYVIYQLDRPLKDL